MSCNSFSHWVCPSNLKHTEAGTEYLQELSNKRGVGVLTGERGCTFCGGLGHRITDCPKLEAMQTKQVTNIGRKDYLAHSSMDF